MAAAAQPKPETPIADPWLRVEPLPCLLTIEISVPGFTVADLVHLEIPVSFDDQRAFAQPH